MFIRDQQEDQTSGIAAQKLGVLGGKGRGGGREQGRDGEEGRGWDGATERIV